MNLVHFFFGFELFQTLWFCARAWYQHNAERTVRPQWIKHFQSPAYLQKQVLFCLFSWVSGIVAANGKQVLPHWTRPSSRASLQSARPRGSRQQAETAGLSAAEAGGVGTAGPLRDRPPGEGRGGARPGGGASSGFAGPRSPQRIPASSSRTPRSLPWQLIHWLGRPDCLAPAAWRHPFTEPASPLRWRRPGGRPDNADASQHNDFQLERPSLSERSLARAKFKISGVGFFLFFFLPPALFFRLLRVPPAGKWTLSSFLGLWSQSLVKRACKAPFFCRRLRGSVFLLGSIPRRARQACWRLGSALTALTPAELRLLPKGVKQKRKNSLP